MAPSPATATAGLACEAGALECRLDDYSAASAEQICQLRAQLVDDAYDQRTIVRVAADAERYSYDEFVAFFNADTDHWWHEATVLEQSEWWSPMLEEMIKQIIASSKLEKIR